MKKIPILVVAGLLAMGTLALTGCGERKRSRYVMQMAAKCNRE